MTIGVTPIAQLRTCVIKNSNIQREVTLCGKSDFAYHIELLLKETIRPPPPHLGANF